jgi:hypothetical protein
MGEFFAGRGFSGKTYGLPLSAWRSMAANHGLSPGEGNSSTDRSFL